MEFLVEITVQWPAGGGSDERDMLLAAERKRTKELAQSGNLVRLWRIPGRWQNVALWSADNVGDLDAQLRSLPMFPWLNIEVRPLAGHPSDPTQGPAEEGSDQ